MRAPSRSICACAPPPPACRTSAHATGCASSCKPMSPGRSHPTRTPIRQFLRAVRNDPGRGGAPAAQLRRLGAAGHRQQLRPRRPRQHRSGAPVSSARSRPSCSAQIAAQVRRNLRHRRSARSASSGFSLPDNTLAATVGRMRAERETVAAQRTAEGLRAAAEIRSDAARDSRITVAEARTEAAEIEAASRQRGGRRSTPAPIRATRSST